MYMLNEELILVEYVYCWVGKVGNGIILLEL